MSTPDDIRKAISGEVEPIPHNELMALSSKLGKDRTPDTSMIIQGKHGNGTYQEMDQELLRQRQAERHAVRHQAKLERIERYEEMVTESLTDAAAMRIASVRKGRDILEKSNHPANAGMPLGKDEVATLKAAQSDAKVIEERTMGKVSAADESAKTQVNIVNLFGGIG